jgi:hypothetical protein
VYYVSPLFKAGDSISGDFSQKFSKTTAASAAYKIKIYAELVLVYQYPSSKIFHINLQGP